MKYNAVVVGFGKAGTTLDTALAEMTEVFNDLFAL